MKHYLLECPRGLLQKTLYTLEKDATIGRDLRNTIFLKDPLVSRRHVRVVRDTKHWVIYDLESRNGTYVNDKRIQRQRLSPGDHIRIGQTTLKFKELDEDPKAVSLRETMVASIGQESQEIYDRMDLIRTFLDALPLGVAILNEKLEVRFCNHELASLAPPGSSHEPGSVCSTLGCPFANESRNSRRCDGCALHNAAGRVFGRGDPIFDEEIPWDMERNLSTAYVRFSMLPLPYRLTGESLAQLTWEDITPRKTAEEALIRAHEQLEQRVRERADELGKAIERLEKEIVVRKETEDRLRFMSTHDSLTGIYNRAFFEEEMARLRRGRQAIISVVMADVDGLKEINDNYGHDVGDELLQRAASVLMNAFRAEDVVARIGGDEFAVLLPGTEAKAAREAVKRIERSLSTENIAHGGPTLSLSLGAATSRFGSSLIDAFREADREMYMAKSHRAVAPDLRGYQKSSRF
jgi:diguanylate cyclase (GGDEF)-like protein